MDTVEQNFLAALEVNRDKARTLGVRLRPIPREELLDAVHRSLRSSRESDGFGALAKLGKLSLSAEALAVDKRFTALFSDAEANAALARLLEEGYRFMPTDGD